MKAILYTVLSFSFLLTSCERKVLNSKSSISISLPGESSVLQSITNPLSSVSLYSTNSGDDEEFNPFIMPAFSAVSTYPVNCYIVAVSSQTSESFFSKNYCGKRSNVTGRIDPEFKFGPFLGLVKAGSNLEIEVPSGDKRVVYVFALHAQNPDACKLLTNGEGENPSKENFSRPYFVGKSSSFSVLPGQTTNVPIQLNQPVASTAIDDCVFPALGNNQNNVANAVAVERNSFPENVMVTAETSGDANPSGYRCDYVDVVPKFKYLNGANTQFKSARFDSQKEFSVYHDAPGGTDPTYRSKYDCENSINSSTSFSIFPSDKKVRRWFHLDYALAPGTNANFKAVSADGTISSQFKLIKLISGRVASGTELTDGTYYFRAGFDISIPKKIIAGQCYAMFVIRKAVEGFPFLSAVTISPFSIDQSPAGSAQFYYSPGCASTTVSSPNIATSFNYASYYFKATQSFELSISNVGGGFTTPVEISTPAKIEVVASSPSLQPEFVELSANDTYSWHASAGCQPITFRLKNKDGVVVPMPANGFIEILFGQSDTFFTNQFSSVINCSGSYLNPGAAQLTVPPGAEFAKIYINNNSAGTEGLKTVRFKVFDGTKYYYLKHTFEVNAPNYPN